MKNSVQIATEKDGFFSENHSSTVIFLILILLQTFLPFFYYNAAPFKVPIYRNYFVFFLILANLILGVVFYYTTEQISGTFQTVFIDYKPVSVVLGIVMGAGVIGLGYNCIVDRFELKN